MLTLKEQGSSSDDKVKTVKMAASVLQYKVNLDADKADKNVWRSRDELIEMVVPKSVLEKLGKNVCAGQLVSVSSTFSPDTQHVARIIPVDICKQPLLPEAAVSALGIDQTKCEDPSHRKVALLSPFLAFNLGLPYHLAQLVPSNNLSTWLHSDSNKITISSIPCTFPSPNAEKMLVMRDTSAPGILTQKMPLAHQVGLAHVRKVQKEPPFDIIEHQTAMEQAAKAAQGGSDLPSQEDPADNELNALNAAEQEAKLTSDMNGIREFLRTPRMLCLGDIIGVTVEDTPLLGPLQTPLNLSDVAQKRVIFFKVIRLHPNRIEGRELHQANEDKPTSDPLVVSHALRVELNGVALEAEAASDVPVGAEMYLIGTPPTCTVPTTTTSTTEPTPVNPTNKSLKVGALGKEAYGVLEQYHSLTPSKLMTGLWRDVAHQMLPYLHPNSKMKNHVGGRVAMLITGSQGCGKATEVYAAAASLGVGVYEVDCRALSGGNPMDEAACVTALTTILQMAKSYAPVVLLLRRLERIFPPQPNPSLVKRFADVLTQLTSALCQPHVPDVTLSPKEGDPPPDPEAPTPVRELPWATLTNGVYPDGSKITLPTGTTVQELKQAHARFTPGVVLVVGTTSQVAEVPTTLRRCFTTEFPVATCSHVQRQEVLEHILGNVSGMDTDDLASAAQGTAGFSARDLGASASDAVLGVMQTCLESGPGHTLDVVKWLDRKVGIAEMEGTLEQVRKRVAMDIGAPKIPKVKWDDVGGLENVKKAILDTIELPLKYRDLFSSGLKRRSGVLLYGPPGTGKTLIAKAVATECTINFISVKGPELINMYVGESEKNIREVFDNARKAQPCVLFFDELDSLAPSRGTGMDSSHVSDRIVAQLLAELDGMGSGRNDDVFVVGATNRPDLLDSALMRPGRLDVLLYVGVDRTTAAKLKVLQALTRKFHMGDDVDMVTISEHVPVQCTGADMYGMCADAWMHALRRTITQCTPARGASSNDVDDELEDVNIVVSMRDFINSVQNLVPSLTVADLDKYDALQEQYAPSGGSKNAALEVEPQKGDMPVKGGLQSLPKR